MGELIIPVCELPCNGDEVTEWYELEQPQSIAQGVSGELQLSLKVTEVNEPWEVSDMPIRELPLPLATALSEHRSKKNHGLIDGSSIKISSVSRPGTLRLRVVEANDLMAMDSPRGTSSATSDPFVEVFLEDSYWRTTTVKKSCNPVWPDAAQIIPVSSLESLLHIVVFDHDVLSSNDYLGEVVMSLEHLTDGEMHDEWFKVQAPPSYNDSGIKGHLRLEMQLMGFEDAGNQASEAQEPATPAYLSSFKSSSFHSSKKLLADSPTSITKKASMMAVSASALSSSKESYRDFEKRMAANRERPFSESVRMFGDGAPARKEIASIPTSNRVASLELRIIGGVGLASRDSNGQSDPYCEAYVWCPGDQSCSHVWRTSTKLKTLNPKWNESQTVHLTSMDAMLHLIAFDWDKFGADDFLGEVPINLRDFADGKRHSLQLELLQLDQGSSKDPVTGYLEVELKLTDLR
eukprot:CAMPEP_0205866586 /NCGR_PEP_ID=MMETSP1083-20121108/8494_1 /ASSEMBLY_ACC=CAM_ASM_000430 /TAXON_ID=97485 /ORGANISM="Prymnesium parvum, Strain Texoma1" /LENGTH=462 /DNA_ID=CAMNT_0053228591 /DNA_START=161 /DNA_END=1549 /DNA_ORIENTATION=+